MSDSNNNAPSTAIPSIQKLIAAEMATWQENERVCVQCGNRITDEQMKTIVCTEVCKVTARYTATHGPGDCSSGDPQFPRGYNSGLPRMKQSVRTSLITKMVTWPVEERICDHCDDPITDEQLPWAVFLHVGTGSEVSWLQVHGLGYCNWESITGEAQYRAQVRAMREYNEAEEIAQARRRVQAELKQRSDPTASAAPGSKRRILLIRP